MRGLSRDRISAFGKVAMAPADIGGGFAKDFGALANAHGANVMADPSIGVNIDVESIMTADGPA